MCTCQLSLFCVTYVPYQMCEFYSGVIGIVSGRICVRGSVLWVCVWVVPVGGRPMAFLGPGWRGGCPSQHSSPWHDLIERSRCVVSGPRFCQTYTGSRPRGYDAEGQLGFGLIRYVGKLGTRCPSGYGAGPLAPWQHLGPVKQHYVHRYLTGLHTGYNFIYTMSCIW